MVCNSLLISVIQASSPGQCFKSVQRVATDFRTSRLSVSAYRHSCKPDNTMAKWEASKRDSALQPGDAPNGGLDAVWGIPQNHPWPDRGRHHSRCQPNKRSATNLLS